LALYYRISVVAVIPKSPAHGRENDQLTPREEGMPGFLEVALV